MKRWNHEINQFHEFFEVFSMKINTHLGILYIIIKKMIFEINFI